MEWYDAKTTFDSGINISDLFIFIFCTDGN